MNVLYKGPYRDLSGYGKAVRDNVTALKTAGIKVNVDDTYFAKTSHFTLPENNFANAPDKIIYHCPPDTIPTIYEDCPKSIVYTTFEANLFPNYWINILNKYADEVFCPSLYNKSALAKSGYNKRVTVIPHALNAAKFNEENDELNLFIPDNVNYTFYSIFQWSARKNPECLIRAYLREFVNTNTLLVLKTYIDFRDDVNFINAKINEIKAGLNLSNYPDILVIPNKLTENQIIALHKKCSCYVSAHHAEGAGLPIMEAMAAKNPVIATRYSGNMEFCNDDTAFLIDYRLTHVYGQTNNVFWKKQYNANMLWADPDELHLGKLMRKVYEERPKNYKGYERMKNHHSHEHIGELMKEALCLN